MINCIVSHCHPNVFKYSMCVPTPPSHELVANGSGKRVDRSGTESDMDPGNGLIAESERGPGITHFSPGEGGEKIHDGP
jgi:hypothetical protein